MRLAPLVRPRKQALYAREKKILLCDILCKRVDIGYDLRAVHTRNGDYAPGELDEAVEGTADAIAQTYREHAVGATLIFSVSVHQAEEIASRIKGAVVVTGETKDRAAIIEAFTAGEIPCIVNCMVFTEGRISPGLKRLLWPGLLNRRACMPRWWAAAYGYTPAKNGWF